MNINLNINITPQESIVILPANSGKIIINNEAKFDKETNDLALILLYDGNRLDKMQLSRDFKENDVQDISKIVTIIPPSKIETLKLIELLEQGGIHRRVISDARLLAFEAMLELIMNTLGLSLVVTKKTIPYKGKAVHRWNKAIADEVFYVDHNNSKATVTWPTRSKMVIKAGATLSLDIPLNKDGSARMDARMTSQLRDENKNKIKGNKTIEDVILKSVNEVGLFLYYGNTNSWLVLKTKDNKTINELSLVNSK
ncbi:hypothetical protein [Mycoplasma sp. P36-A1]|uniref:hypothetical protein n=1 Tax=Mycoplasma sp. P36-A1 TaxID=3252900 RepID=UPI003C308E5C